MNSPSIEPTSFTSVRNTYLDGDQRSGETASHAGRILARLTRQSITTKETTVPRLLICLIAALTVAGCGSTSGKPDADRSRQIEAETGAADCHQTRYSIIVRADNSHLPIYDCYRRGKTICVTEQNGIASDSTETARLVFSDSLTGKPSCLTAS